MNKVEEILRELIRKEGPVTFERFMDTILYSPEHGFYMSERERLGPDGDFYTSPHLHPLFGWMIAIQLDQLKQIIAPLKEFTILEVGAGKGYLAEAVITYIEEELNWSGRWRYVIVERNPHIRRSQAELLSEHTCTIEWKSSLEEIDQITGCILTNELLDSFPVHLIEMSNRFHEICLDYSNNRLKEARRDLSRRELADYIERYSIPRLNTYRTEINLRVKDFLQSADRVLSEGFILTIDYGYSSEEYYTEERRRGTLLCYHRHSENDNPYINLGDQDITTHVNFTSLKDWAEELGMKTLGYAPQGTFLVSLGVDEVIAKEMERKPDFLHDISIIKGLLFGMGETHKVMLQYKGNKETGDIKGFQLRNRIGIL